MKYRIIDKDNMNTLQDERFTLLSKVEERLVDYHSIDNDFRNISLIEILDLGNWSIEYEYRDDEWREMDYYLMEYLDFLEDEIIALS